MSASDLEDELPVPNNADRRAAASDSSDDDLDSQLSEVDEAQFANFDPRTVAALVPAPIPIDESNVGLLGVHKRKRGARAPAAPVSAPVSEDDSDADAVEKGAPGRGARRPPAKVSRREKPRRQRRRPADIESEEAEARPAGERRKRAPAAPRAQQERRPKAAPAADDESLTPEEREFSVTFHW
jgi:transcription factor SPN1